jgi:hypothetical protein
MTPRDWKITIEVPDEVYQAWRKFIDSERGETNYMNHSSEYLIEAMRKILKSKGIKL